jgi:hypothetical protein
LNPGLDAFGMQVLGLDALNPGLDAFGIQVLGLDAFGVHVPGCDAFGVQSKPTPNNSQRDLTLEPAYNL